LLGSGATLQTFEEQFVAMEPARRSMTYRRLVGYGSDLLMVAALGLSGCSVISEEASVARLALGPGEHVTLPIARRESVFPYGCASGAAMICKVWGGSLDCKCPRAP
jgi:hypothetical protein